VARADAAIAELDRAGERITRLEERGRVKAEPGEGLRHVAVVAGVGLVSLLGGAALLALVDLVHGRGLAVDLLGALAAAAALPVVVVLARHSY
jgi:hypothetical protein